MTDGEKRPEEEAEEEAGEVLVDTLRRRGWGYGVAVSEEHLLEQIRASRARYPVRFLLVEIGADEG